MFAQADSWGGELGNPQTLNAYMYTLGNPLNLVDPSGHITLPPNIDMGGQLPADYMQPLCDHGGCEGGSFGLETTVTGVDPTYDPPDEVDIIIAAAIDTIVTAGDIGLTIGAIAYPGSRVLNLASVGRDLAQGNYFSAGLGFALGPVAGKLYNPAVSRTTSILKTVSGEAAERMTVIGRMEDLKQFADNPNIDTWFKSGRMPGPGDPPISWKENLDWLTERIQRGDKFGIATDPKTLPPVRGGHVPGKPNGYFTARELEVIQKAGIEPKRMY